MSKINGHRNQGAQDRRHEHNSFSGNLQNLARKNSKLSQDEIYNRISQYRSDIERIEHSAKDFKDRFSRSIKLINSYKEMYAQDTDKALSSGERFQIEDIMQQIYNEKEKLSLRSQEMELKINDINDISGEIKSLISESDKVKYLQSDIVEGLEELSSKLGVLDSYVADFRGKHQELEAAVKPLAEMHARLEQAFKAFT